MSVVPDFSCSDDSERTHEIAMDTYEDGIDVIFLAVGGSGIGAVDAAHDHSVATGRHVWIMGVDVGRTSRFPKTWNRASRPP